ncbi:glycosyltransferase family 4 protein [Streptomyces sp. HK10]|uniref:glycosyltransferase family 4 protein n=1 Tax=Streptomyces sp. HK10 TaxID=3373255 RepID=UPI003748C50D
MKVAALVHFCVPYRMAGSETMLHTLLVALQRAGHEAVVATTHTPHAPQHWRWEGVRGLSRPGPREAAAAVRAEDPDVVITQHQNTGLGIDVARTIGAKSVFLMHNDFTLNRGLLAKQPDLVVFNTAWIAEKYAARVARSVVVHPPVWPHQHATTPGDAVTLVNLNEDKGAPLLYELARRMPDVRFLGVMGAHGRQIAMPRPTVEIVPQTTDMRRDVWSRTRVLLMPSRYESYGMAAVEALASGIPVIANPTPGLRESLGPAGLFVGRDDVAGWEQTLRRLLDDPAVWGQASSRARARSAELDPAPELERWVTAVEEVVRGGSARDDDGSRIPAGA